MNVRQLLKQFDIYARMCADSRSDVSALRAEQPVNYSLDFSLLCPVLFSQPGPGSGDFALSSTAAIRRILDPDARQDFQLVMSGLTLIEFFDQLDHHLTGIDHPHFELYAAVDRNTLREELLTSSQLRDRLHQYTPTSLDSRLRRPVEKLERLIATGTLKGIGDVVDVAAVRRATDTDQFQHLLDQQRTRRKRFDTRGQTNSEFHYKIDAGNACLTVASARTGDAPAYFVTNAQLNIDQCWIGDTNFARLDKTPLFVRNAMAGRRSELIGDESAFLDDVACEAFELAERLRPYEELEDAPARLQTRVARFFTDDIALLGQTDTGDPDVIAADVEEIVETFADPKRLRSLLQEAAADAREGARKIEDEAFGLDLAYADQFDLADDPVVVRLRARLGVLGKRYR